MTTPAEAVKAHYAAKLAFHETTKAMEDALMEGISKLKTLPKEEGTGKFGVGRMQSDVSNGNITVWGEFHGSAGELFRFTFYCSTNVLHIAEIAGCHGNIDEIYCKLQRVERYIKDAFLNAGFIANPLVAG